MLNRLKRFDALLHASASIVWWTNAAGEFVEEQPIGRLTPGRLRKSIEARVGYRACILMIAIASLLIGPMLLHQADPTSHKAASGAPGIKSIVPSRQEALPSKMKQAQSMNGSAR